MDSKHLVFSNTFKKSLLHSGYRCLLWPGFFLFCFVLGGVFGFFFSVFFGGLFN